MEKLNEEIMSKILSHVPIEFVSRCKLVCRSWERLLSDRTGGLLFSIASRGQTIAKLYHADYYDLMNIDNPHRDEPNYSFETHATEIDHPPIDTIKEHNKMCMAVGSCNGLVCFFVPHNGLSDPVYVCNPISGEYVNLPRFNRKNCGYIVGGFGYLSSTNEYKVVRICYPTEKRMYPNSSSAGWIQVYTLGNNSNSGWRDVGEITNALWLPGVQANGALHFMDDMDRKIVTFDLESEEFWVLPPPPCFENSKNSSYQVRVLGGHLYVVHQHYGEHVDLWSFRHNENRHHYDRREKNYESWIWSKKFSVDWTSTECWSTYDFNQPFAITEKNEVLFWVNNWNLSCCDHQTDVFKRIVNMNEDRRLSIFQGIPYKSSHVFAERFRSTLKDTETKHK
ncbi:F-box protein At3g07870-like [Papaver somniferum]|uniref:F-box protein At3g07870-like n=1 Tax=Papaver somniferum TaxID=3469 RepID=UPI000E7030C4|nr:F-box protein At3g07870-like [Papaver somniferum]